MLASIVVAAAVATSQHVAIDGAELQCRAGGGAALRLWRGDEARPERVLERAAPGGATFVVTLSNWSVEVLPLDGPVGDFGLQVIDDANGRLKSSTTLLSCDGGGKAPLRLRLDPGSTSLAFVDQARRLR